MANTKLRVEQDNKTPEGEDQRQRKLIQALPFIVVVVDTLVVFVCFVVLGVRVVVPLDFDMQRTLTRLLHLSLMF